MISILFYIVYGLLAFGCSWCILIPGYTRIALLALIFTTQFNVTVFLKVGITISFFEVSLFITTFLALCKMLYMRQSIRFQRIDGIALCFLIIAFMSIIIAQFRILSGNLVPHSLQGIHPFFRSLMSLNRIFVYLPCLIILRNFWSREKDFPFRYYFMLYLAYSGLLPTCVSILQFLEIPVWMIFNNPSFSETFHIEAPIRACGLTNEASFYVFQLFFSFIALFYAYVFRYISKNRLIVLGVFYLFGVLISVSRTGLLIFLIFILYQYAKDMNWKKMIGIPVVLLLLSGVLINLNFMGFNMFDRLLSSFNKVADLSTIERFGSTEALIGLFADKSLLFGVGIYNYAYYLMKYIPEYMYGFVRDQVNYVPPSFNFIIQLLAEFGLILGMIYFIITIRLLIKTDSFIRNWFLFLFLFALSFQVLNFAIPFMIFLYPFNANYVQDEKNIISA